MQIQHDLGARPPAPRPSLLVAGVSRAGRGEAVPQRFLDAVDGSRAPTTGPAPCWRWKPVWLVTGAALLVAAGVVLSAGWPQRQAPATAVNAPPQRESAAADVAAPARGPARIERLETPPAPPAPWPVVLAASTPVAGAAQVRLDSPAVVAAAVSHGRARSPMPRRQEKPVAATDAPVPAGPAWTPAEAPADPEPLRAPEGLQADADAALLRAVMDWDRRHPPAPVRAAAPAARASSPR